MYIFYLLIFASNTHQCTGSSTTECDCKFARLPPRIRPLTYSHNHSKKAKKEMYVYCLLSVTLEHFYLSNTMDSVFRMAIWIFQLLLGRDWLRRSNTRP